MNWRYILLVTGGAWMVGAGIGCRSVPATASIDSPEPPAAVRLQRDSPADRSGRKPDGGDEAEIAQARVADASEAPPNRLTRWLTPRSKTTKPVFRQKRIPLPLEEETTTSAADSERSLDDF
jgi:hypothetical protein